MFGRRSRDETQGPEWGIATDLGEGWCPLPLDRDPEEFGAEVVEILIEDVEDIVGKELPRERAEALASEFVTMTGQAQRTGAYAASILRPHLDGPMVAMLQTHVYPPEPGVELGAWTRRFYDEMGGRADLERAQLPVGAAVRVRHMSGPPTTGGPDAAAETVVVESLTYVFEAPGGELVHHQLSWVDADADEMTDLADRIAHDLAFQ